MNPSNEADQRLTDMLETAMGAAGKFLGSPDVVEIMLNADGRLWIDELGKGRADTGYTIAPQDAERIIYLVATLIGQECDHQNPLLSAELPGC
jgi:Flp pilus assembly CpaF family ATPase